jgi:hypothetical protein
MWEAVRWAHLIAMAFFVGGQLVLASAVVPAFRRAEGAGREPLRAIARGFGQGTLVAIAVLIVTGAAMASHYDDWDDAALQVKLALVALAAVLVVVHMRRPQAHALEGAIFLVSLGSCGSASRSPTDRPSASRSTGACRSRRAWTSRLSLSSTSASTRT